MKPLSLTISIISMILNTFIFAKETHASPIKTLNVTGQELQFRNTSDLKSPTLISKYNDFLSNDLDLKLNPVKIKHSSYQIKMEKSTSETSNTEFKNNFKDTFKDTSSTFISNYGPVTRAPDESTKHCKTKACFE